MNRYAKLQSQKAETGKALRAILDGALEADGQTPRLLTDEEKGKVQTLEASLTALQGEIEREERLRAAEAVTAVPLASPAQVTRDLAAERPWESLGHWALAVRQAALGHGTDPRLLFQAAATGMGEAVGTDGGFAVPVEMAAGIEKTMWETGELLSRVDGRDITGNAITYNVIKETSRADGSRRGAVLGYWIDEGTAPTASSVKLAQVEMKLRKVGALGYMTDELLADAPALASELQLAFIEELQFQVENAIYRGGGATQPLGFLNGPCLVSVAKETGQAADTILTTNLSKMWARMPARSKANAVWLINVDCEPQLDELTIPAGTAAVEPRFVSYGPDGLLRIKGRPVLAVEYAASIGDQGDIALVDLSQYRLIRKAGGVQMASSIHVRFTQGENTFRAIYRVDGQPMPRAAITPFKGSATLSPFVVLDAR